MSNVLVNGAIAALASVFAMLIGNLALTQSAFVLPLGLLVGLLTFYLAGALNPDPVRHVGGRRGNQASAASSDLEEQSAKAAAKKAKKAAAEKAKREAAEEAKAEEAAAKAAAKKAAAKKAAKPAAAAAPAGKKAAAVVESESESEAEKSESEAEEEVSAAPKSKSALKKAKAKAKEAAAKAEAEKAAKAAAAAEKKANKKKGAAAAEPAPVAAAAAAPAAKAKPTAAEKAASKAAAAAAAADTEGWETIEAPKPTKSQLEKQAAAAAAAAPASKGKNAKSEPVPSSERMLTIDLQVDPEFHSRIIGPQGTTMQLLVAGSGASIDMPKRDASIRKNIVQITGTPAQVASAQNAILSLTTRGFSNLTHPGTLSDDLTVDPKDMGLIMGPNGSTVAQIQKATGTKIKLPERNSNDKKVLIVGEKDAVKAAKAALKSLITDGYSPITHPDWIKEEVDFPADRFGLLIGNKGQTIKSIQGNSKNQVRIRLPERGSKSSTVTVVGLPSAVAKARSEIEALLVPVAALPDEDLATDDAWGQEHTAQGEDALW